LTDSLTYQARRRTLAPREEKYFATELLPRLQHIARQQVILGPNQAWNLSHFSSGRGEFASASQEIGYPKSSIWSNPGGWWPKYFAAELLPRLQHIARQQVIQQTRSGGFVPGVAGFRVVWVPALPSLKSLKKMAHRAPAGYSLHQPPGLDQINDFGCPISWLAEANSPLPDEKWLKIQA